MELSVEKRKTIALTFDADWAPDYVLQHLFSLLNRHGIRATFFLTNPIEIEIPSNIEIGIHPDFRMTSPQGSDYNSIIDQMLTWFPNAGGVRNHCWHWDDSLYELFPAKGIEYDSSLFLPLHPGLLPTTAYGKLIRFPVWWTDNLHLYEKFALDRVSIPRFDTNGLKVMIFHPLKVYLNPSSFDAGKKSSILPTTNPTQEQLESLRNPGVGLDTFFNELCSYLTQNGNQSYTLGELKDEYLNDSFNSLDI